MSKQKKKKTATLRISSDVAREIRQHARSHNKTEVCGVLIGTEDEAVTSIVACISGANAAQGGTHVTFTQDTWEHIYKIKDRDYPNERIVGWYHSHPGFGVFLSDHDTFIHKNFFSSPQQVAWVYDPHSDEEGCFGWNGECLERLSKFAVVDSRGGEPAGASENPQPMRTASGSPDEWGDTAPTKSQEKDEDLSRLSRTVSFVFSHLAVLILGGLLAWYLLPHVVILPVPVDPQTGQPLKEYQFSPSSDSKAPNSDKEKSNAGQSSGQPEPSKPAETKRSDVR
jgi:proteasome lid subunit RPN8/RPN11